MTHTTAKTTWKTGDPGHIAEHNLIGGKINQIVSVEDYGAVNNLAVDSTTAIQAAIDDNINKGGLYFPGQYKITAPLTVTGPIVFYGNGKGYGPNLSLDLLFSTIQLYGTNPEAAIIVTGKGFEMKDMILRGNKDVDGAVTGCGIIFRGTSPIDAFRLQSCAIRYFKQSGIYIENTVYMVNLIDTYSCFNDGYGFYVRETTPDYIPCYMQLFGCEMGGNAAGQLLNDSDSNVIKAYGCLFADGLVGVENLNGTLGLFGCSFEGGTYGLKHSGSRGLSVVGCTFYGISDCHAYFTDVSNVFIGSGNLWGFLSGNTKPTLGDIASTGSTGANCVLMDGSATVTNLAGFKKPTLENV